MLGINSVVLLVCVVDTVSPETLKIELFEAGKTVNNSLPSGVPVNGTPKPIVVPLTLILEGLADVSEAEPPDILRVKSETSKVDVALAVPP